MTRPFRPQGGVTLIELLVVLAIGAIIAAAMASLFAQSSATREQVNRTSQRIENGRYALDAIAEDARLAGYYGDLWPVGNMGYNTDITSNANPCASTLADIQTQWAWNVGTPPSATVPVPVIGLEGHGAAYSLPTGCSAILTNHKTGTDIIALRRASTLAIVPSALSGTGAVALQVSTQTSLCPTESGLMVDSNPSNLTLHRADPSCGQTAVARPLVTHIYYVATCNNCSGGGDGIPTLKLAEMINGTFTVRSIAPGIDHLHLEYGIDWDGDGAVDEYRVPTNHNTKLDDVAGREWFDVVSVKAYVLARDLESTTQYTDSQSHTLGTKTVAAYGDSVKRSVSTTTIRLVNMAGRRES
ncbi:MAG: PilW family protein [Rhodocyclales bacterium]|nr:PilW family protein [Rhodocyclales bacterium]